MEIDKFSNFVEKVPLKNKIGQITNEKKQITLTNSKRRPHIMGTDDGREFK